MTPRPRDSGPLVYLVVGEPSGDQIGWRLMHALKEKTGGKIRFAGLGGERMVEEGLEPLFPIGDLALMGVLELLPHLRVILRRMDEVVADVRAKRPDIFVSIDAPAFSLRVARRLKGEGIPLVHYVAPTVWAWSPGRARRIARFLDHLLLIFPFEAPLFEKHGLETTFVGHTAAEVTAGHGDRDGFRAARDIPAAAPVLCVLPGSRRGEISRHLGVIARTLARLAERFPDLQCVVPTVPAVADSVEEAAEAWPVPAHVLRDRALKPDAFAASDAALAASGTVTLETALAGLPTIVIYRINPITAFFGRILALTPYVNVLNYMADREILPEYLQERCRPDLLADALGRLLADPEAREAQRAAVAPVAARLKPEGALPSERAADAILSLIERARTE